jgi:hypothetical protein
MSTGKDFRDSVILERFIAEATGKIQSLTRTIERLGPEHPQVVSLQEERATLERMRAALEERRRHTRPGTGTPRGNSPSN